MDLPFNIPADKTYAVIELIKDGAQYACVAPTNWLHDTRITEEEDIMVKKGLCYWPRDERKLSEWVERRRKPDADTSKWSVQEVTILKLCKLFTTAKEKANTALDKSVLSSTGAESPEAKKRPVAPKKIFDPSHKRRQHKEDQMDYSSDADSEDSLRTIPLQILSSSTRENSGIVGKSQKDTLPVFDLSPIQPKDKEQKMLQPMAEKETPQRMDEEETLSWMDEEVRLQPLNKPEKFLRGNCEAEKVSRELFTEEASSAGKSQAGTSGSISKPSPPKMTATPNKKKATPEKTAPKKATPRKAASKKTTPKKPTTPKTKTTSTPRKTATTANGKSLKSPKAHRQTHSHDHNACVRQLAAVNHSLSQLNIKVDKVLLHLCPEIELSATVDESNKGGIPALPLMDKEAEENCLKWLAASPSNGVILTRFLSGYGSAKGRRETVHGVLRKLLSNELSRTFNFMGRNREGYSKSAFKETKFYPIVIAAAKKYANKISDTDQKFSTNDKDLNGDIMAWLKDGSKRVKMDEAKKSKHDLQESNEDEFS